MSFAAVYSEVVLFSRFLIITIQKMPLHGYSAKSKLPAEVALSVFGRKNE